MSMNLSLLTFPEQSSQGYQRPGESWTGELCPQPDLWPSPAPACVPQPPSVQWVDRLVLRL